jgi:mRNA-degrading endonuclease RelE of RelBE toxin-antitoxin system
VPPSRRGRPTVRCLVDDLGIELPSLDIDLRNLDHPLLEEARRLASTSPQGQKRILAIDHPLVYRIRVSDYRGVTWVDEEHDIVWLCATRRREEGSEEDAYRYFQHLNELGNLLPTDDDYLRDRAEAAIRLQRGLTAELLGLVDHALATAGNEYRQDLGGWLPCRVLVLESGGVQEIWCALGTRAIDGSGVKPQLRDLLFAALERHVAPGLFEPRNDWPIGPVNWAEVVVLGLR